MITEFTNRFIASRQDFEARLRTTRPDNYADLVKMVVETIRDPDENWGNPDPKRVEQIDHGDYQGTLVFVIGAGGYQPSTYWYVRISYGSCSGCDTLEALRSWGDEATEAEVNGYWTLALHIAQAIREMDGETA